jgi:hypothetical protein
LLRRKKRSDDSSSKSKGTALTSAGGTSGGSTSNKESHLLRKGQLGIPLVVEDLTNYLEDALDTSGLFRESGKAELVDEILNSYEANRPIDLSRIDDVHAVAVALKTYYKKRLPQPFLDVEFASEYLRHKDMRPTAERIKAQRTVIQRMPKAKVDELKHLLNFLHRVSLRKSKNKMDARNLAIVFGPALFQSAFIVEATDVVVLLIEDYEALFEGAKVDESSDDKDNTSSPASDKHVFVGKVRALYDYEPAGNNPGEMRLEEGDIVSLIEDVDENGWAQGSCEGRVGWFPMSYCERIDGSGDDSEYYSEEEVSPQKKPAAKGAAAKGEEGGASRVAAADQGQGGPPRRSRRRSRAAAAACHVAPRLVRLGLGLRLGLRLGQRLGQRLWQQVQAAHLAESGRRLRRAARRDCRPKKGSKATPIKKKK